MRLRNLGRLTKSVKPDGKNESRDGAPIVHGLPRCGEDTLSSVPQSQAVFAYAMRVRVAEVGQTLTCRS